MLMADRQILTEHYSELKEKPFLQPFVEFRMSVPIVAIIAEVNRAIERFRQLAVVTDPTEAYA